MYRMVHDHTYRYDTEVLRGGGCGCTTGRYKRLLMLQSEKSTLSAVAPALLLYFDMPGTY